MHSAEGEPSGGGNRRLRPRFRPGPEAGGASPGSWYRLCLVIVVCIAPILVRILIEHGAFPDGVHSWLTSKGGAVTTIVAWAILVGTVHNIIQTRRRLGFGVTDLNGIGAGCGQGMGAAARKASVSAQSRAVEGRQP